MTIRATASKAEINDLANLTFISDKANGKISDRSPAVYFEDLQAADPSFLSDHLVPTDPSLRSVETYPQFVAKRRELLASAMNEVLETHRPDFLSSRESTEVESEAKSLVLQAYGTSIDAGDLIVAMTATAGSSVSTSLIAYDDLARLLSDLGDGLGGDIDIDGQLVAVPAGDDLVLPVGGLEVRGSVTDWGRALERELEDIAPPAQAPNPSGSLAPASDLVPFSILASE